MNDQANRLGRLQPVELRNIWTSEAGDFTPWLASVENLAVGRTSWSVTRFLG